MPGICDLIRSDGQMMSEMVTAPEATGRDVFQRVGREN